MAFNFGQMLGAAAEGGIPAYNQANDAVRRRQLEDLYFTGHQALGRALFSGPIPGVGPIGGQGPQPPPPGQQSMPAPRPYPPVQGPPQQQIVGDMFGGMGRPVEMGPPPTAMVPPVQPPPQAPPPGVGGGAPPPAGGAPPAGVGMHDPILARIAAANPGAPPQVLMSAYQQYVQMGRARSGLSPESLALRQQREQRLLRHENRMGQAEASAAAPVQRAINPQTGHVIIMQGGQWVDEQSGQPLAAPAAKPGKQSAADNTEFSSQARYRAPETKVFPPDQFDPYHPEKEILGGVPSVSHAPNGDLLDNMGMDKEGAGRQPNMPLSERFRKFRPLQQDRRSAMDNTEFSAQARVYKGGGSENYNPTARGGSPKLDPEYQPEARKYKGAEVPMEQLDKEQMARAQKEARPHMADFLKGATKDAAANIKRAFKGADLDSLERLHELTPRQRYNMGNFLADSGEFPTTNTDYEAVYGRDTTMGEKPSPMTTKRWGRAPNMPADRRFQYRE